MSSLDKKKKTYDIVILPKAEKEYIKLDSNLQNKIKDIILSLRK